MKILPTTRPVSPRLVVDSRERGSMTGGEEEELRSTRALATGRSFRVSAKRLSNIPRNQNTTNARPLTTPGCRQR